VARAGRPLQEKLKTSIAAGEPIDVFQNGWGSWGDFEEALLELSSLFARDKIDPYQVLVRPAVDTFMDKGKLWGFGLVGVSQDALAYNQDMFDAAGLAHPPVDPTDKSWTMELFLEDAQKLTQPDKLQFGFGGTIAGFDTGGMTRGTFFGQGPWDDNTQKAQLDQPGQVQGLQYFKDLRDKYHVQPTADQVKALGAKGDVFHQRQDRHAGDLWLRPQAELQVRGSSRCPTRRPRTSPVVAIRSH